MLLNKLASNSLPDEWRPEGRKLAVRVQLTPNSAPVTTPEALLRAMLKELHADAYMQILSRVTAFGLGALRSAARTDPR